MLVCAHGNVTEFCEKREMIICEIWHGNLRDYRGPCRVLVTDHEMSVQEYCYLKGELLAKGIELISTEHKDDEAVSKYLLYASGRRKARVSGRPAFADEVVIRRVRELHSQGLSIRAIQMSDGICRPDGSRFSVSTIHKFIQDGKNEV